MKFEFVGKMFATISKQSMGVHKERWFISTLKISIIGFLIEGLLGGFPSLLMLILLSLFFQIFENAFIAFKEQFLPVGSRT